MDWVYVRNEGSADMGVTLHLLAAARGQARWCEVLGHAGESAHYSNLAGRLGKIVSAWFDRTLKRALARCSRSCTPAHSTVSGGASAAIHAKPA